MPHHRQSLVCEGQLLEFLAAALVAQLHAIVQQFLFLSQARVHVGRIDSAKVRQIDLLTFCSSFLDCRNFESSFIALLLKPVDASAFAQRRDGRTDVLQRWTGSVGCSERIEAQAMCCEKMHVLCRDRCSHSLPATQTCVTQIKVYSRSEVMDAHVLQRWMDIHGLQ